MKAREMFQRGDRVRIMMDGRKVERNAVVAGFGHSPFVVRVVADGCTTPVGYHMKFIELATSRAEGEDAARNHKL